MDQHTSALIVAPPGLLREGLRAALNTLPRLETVSEADNAAQAMVMMHNPAFVLLSIEGPETDNLDAIGKIKARWPAARCIVLVDTVAQQQAARATGAEEVVIKGVRPTELLASIERLLEDEGPVAPESESQERCGAQV